MGQGCERLLKILLPFSPTIPSPVGILYVWKKMVNVFSYFVSYHQADVSALNYITQALAHKSRHGELLWPRLATGLCYLWPMRSGKVIVYPFDMCAALITL